MVEAHKLSANGEVLNLNLPNTGYFTLAKINQHNISITKTSDGEEGGQNMVFTISTNPENGLTFDITGDLIYSGSATKGTDFNAPASYTIPAGASSTTITIPITDDNDIEGTETVTATLGSNINIES